jgi:hypothetical protein
MDKSRFKVVKQTVIIPNKSPQTLITDLGRENHQRVKNFTNSSRATNQHSATILDHRELPANIV